jgi:hypothetical protein
MRGNPWPPAINSPTLSTPKIAARGVHEEAPQAEGTLTFAAESELDALTAGWPSSRLIDVWNRLPDHTPVKKFTNRKTAIRRIWRAVQGIGTPRASNPPSKTRKVTAKARAKPQAAGTKSETVLALLRQTGGATLQALMAATGWQAHSVRGFISGQVTKKMRLKIKSFKRDGERVYSIRS